MCKQSWLSWTASFISQDFQTTSLRLGPYNGELLFLLFITMILPPVILWCWSASCNLFHCSYSQFLEEHIASSHTPLHCTRETTDIISIFFYKSSLRESEGLIYNLLQTPGVLGVLLPMEFPVLETQSSCKKLKNVLYTLAQIFSFSDGWDPVFFAANRA